MKKFAVLLLAVVAALFVVDRISGVMLWWMSQHTRSTLARKTRQIVFETDADVVCLGTSRCYHHYDPRVMADSLGMTVYNGGLDATDNIYSHYIVLSLMLERHTPRMVCLDVFRADFLKQSNDRRSLIKFAPYYGRNVAADSVFSLDPQNWAYAASHIYRYNNQLLTNAFGFFAPEKAEFAGFNPIEGTHYSEPSVAESYSAAEIDSAKMAYIGRFITACRSCGVEPVLVTSPHYNYVDSGYYSPLRDLASRYGVVYLDYHTGSDLVGHLEYFSDLQHLNDRGADLFSKRLSHDLKERFGSTWR